MNAILDRETITQTLRRDKILKQSLGLRPKYTTTKWFAVIWGIWVVSLVISPLPETIALNAVSMLMTAVFTAIFLGVDAIQNASREATLADRLYNLLERIPKLEVQQREKTGIAHIVHPKFQADCELDTALLLDEMVMSERETKMTIETVSAPETSAVPEVGESKQKGKE